MGKIFISAVFYFCALEGFAQNDGQKTRNSKNHTPAFQALIFLATDCPISQDYIGALNKMEKQYSKAGKVLGIFPAKINKRELRNFQREYQVNFLLKVDKNFSLAKKYDIRVTPEVILLDSSGNIQYRGAIDNWYYQLGQHRQVANENYLLDAIEAILAGRAVVTKKTEPVGCILPKWN